MSTTITIGGILDFVPDFQPPVESVRPEKLSKRRGLERWMENRLRRLLWVVKPTPRQRSRIEQLTKEL